MSSTRSLTPLDASQYNAIESAVRETERGRWFLTEYARRNRNADTGILLDAIRRIETVVTTERGDDVGRFRGDLMEMADAIARTRAEVAALSHPAQGESRLTAAPEALDAIVRATQRAASDILGAAEEIQEAAWTLRESGADSDLCDILDRHATQIYTASSFQDLTAQRTSRVVHTLRYLEERIASMIGIRGGPVDPLPAIEANDSAPVALDQTDIDRFLDMGPAPTPAPCAAVTAPPEEAPVSADPAIDAVPDAAATGEALSAEVGEVVPVDESDPPDDLTRLASSDIATSDMASPPGDDLASAFPDLDTLSIEEKIALFA